MLLFSNFLRKSFKKRVLALDVGSGGVSFMKSFEFQQNRAVIGAEDVVKDIGFFQILF